MDIYDKSVITSNYIVEALGLNKGSIPTSAIITGSGSDGIMVHFKTVREIPFSALPHMPPATFHKGKIILAENSKGKPVLICLGRLHFYEGYTAQQITYPVRVLQALGITRLFMTNASGGLNPKYSAGDIILVKDHINLLPDHPLRGINDERLGVRFPDMSDAYTYSLSQEVSGTWRNLHGAALKEGVYVCFQGPSLETKAEYKYLHDMGADMVGMSTVPEVIVAVHAGMQVCVLSIVTNVCYPPEDITPTTVEEVIEMADKVVGKIGVVFSEVI